MEMDAMADSRANYPGGIVWRCISRLGRHPFFVVFTLAVLTPLYFGFDWWFLPNTPVRSAKKVESVTFHHQKWKDWSHGDPVVEHPEVRVVVSDPEVIQRFLDVFKTAQRGSEHKCGGYAEIEIRLTDGTTETLSILPGHNERYYEYRFGSRINKVDRTRFLEALAAMGVTDIKTEPP
jgi:hypothetical protein